MTTSLPRSSGCVPPHALRAEYPQPPHPGNRVASAAAAPHSCRVVRGTCCTGALPLRAGAVQFAHGNETLQRRLLQAAR